MSVAMVTGRLKQVCAILMHVVRESWNSCVPGAHPRNFSIHPSGDWVLVANQEPRLGKFRCSSREPVSAT